jgi:hypothetical protein
LEVWPVSELENGWLGLHQTSVVSPTAESPMASTADGKRMALAIEATFGLKPCCWACFQNVAKSGGMSTP